MRQEYGGIGDDDIVASLLFGSFRNKFADVRFDERTPSLLTTLNHFCMEALVAVLFLVTLLGLTRLGVVLVPPGKAAIIERRGRFHRSLSSGLHTIVPFLDRVRVKISVGEQSLVLNEDQCKTADGRLLQIQCTIRWMITDPEKAIFSITDHQLALTTAARLLLHEETAKLAANQLISDIPAATLPLTAKLRDTALRWGIQVLGIEMVVQTPGQG